MVSAREKLSKCAMWEADRRVLNELKDTGFDHLYELSKHVGRCHHDNRMIQTLIDNYDTERCVFRVNGRDMLLGLQDVAYLIGLNIDGKLVVSSKEKINVLGAVPYVMKKNGCSVRMSWLKDTFEKVPEGVGDSELEKYVSAFALYIVGTVILPTSDHVYVSLQYLDCVSKDKIKENAWGVAMLAHIHHCLKQYKIKKMAAIGAHMHLLMVWALEHFPKFAQELLFDDAVVPSQFPLSCSWAQLISKVLQKKYEIKKKNYQQHLVNLGNDYSDNKFVSKPYGRVLDLPPRLLEQLEMAIYVGPLVHPMHKKILPDHRPDLCPDQLGFEGAVVSDSPSFLKKTCEYRSWRLHQNAWKKRKECLMRDSVAAEEQHMQSPASHHTLMTSQPHRKTKLDKVIEKQKEYAALEKKHKFEMQKMQKVENDYAALQIKHQLQLEEKVKVENELKDCRVEIQKLKEELSVIEKKHRNEYEDVEQKYQSNGLEMLKIQNEVTRLKEERRLLEGKHKSEYKALEQKHQYDRLEMLKVENELKVCKDALVEMKQEQKLLEEKHKNDYKALEQKYQSHLLEVENELKHCKAELKGVKEEKNISNEKYEKLLEEVNEHRKDEDELGNFEYQKNKEDAISRVRKIMNAELLALQNMAKISKNNGVTHGSRNQNCIEIPKHVIDVEDLCDSVPPNVSPRRNAVGNSGTSKSSYVEAILLSDSDDDCAPEEPESFGLKRKRTSSLNASDNNNCGHHLEEESFPTAENKLRRMLGRCDFVVSDYGRQNNPSSCNPEISKQRSSIESPAKVNGESDSSSASIFSSDDSDDDGDINLVSTLMSITNRP